MLVTFKTNTYSDITMFGNAAVSLLKLMGQSGNVPGAIMAEDVPAALQLLQQGLADLPAEQKDDTPDKQDDDEKEVPIGLGKRAGPLLSLLQAASEAHENVLWNGE